MKYQWKHYREARRKDIKKRDLTLNLLAVGVMAGIGLVIDYAHKTGFSKGVRMIEEEIQDADLWDEFIDGTDSYYLEKEKDKDE